MRPDDSVEGRLVRVVEKQLPGTFAEQSDRKQHASSPVSPLQLPCLARAVAQNRATLSAFCFGASSTCWHQTKTPSSTPSLRSYMPGLVSMSEIVRNRGTPRDCQRMGATLHKCRYIRRLHVAGMARKCLHPQLQQLDESACMMETSKGTKARY